MDAKINILLVEDSATDADILVRHLRKEKIDFDYSRVWSKEGFVESIMENTYDLVIADQNLPQFSGLEAFKILKLENDTIPFILISGSVSEKFLHELTKEGIDDYIVKGNLLRLSSAIENVIYKKQIQQLNNDLKYSNYQLHRAYSKLKSSINYAKLIQDSILPDLSVLASIFPDYYILFKPKDVVSGDFYWFEKSENTLFLAVADCTGHGVPGALLAMMGNNLLTEAINVKKIKDSGVILARLHKRVQRILKSSSNTLDDGMDIALCSIDIENKTLQYAGANHPIFIERKGNLIELKPVFIAIGETRTEEQFTYQNQSITLEPKDRIFMFTDGYPDQFSDKTDKKITKKRLKELILKTASLPMQEQKEQISDYFENWKGNKVQIDDMLLLCVEVS